MPDFSDPAVLQLYLDKGYGLATGMLLAVFILAVGWMASKWVHGLVRRSASKLDQAVASFLASMARYATLAATIIAALNAVGVETTSLVAIFGAAGLAVGLALQGSLSNFASGVMILTFRPFQLADVVSAGGQTGGVHDIGLFATTLITPDNHTIIVPNSAITGGVITNYTRQGTRRMAIDIGVAYGTDLKAVQEAALAAAGKCPLVLDDPAPAVAFTEMAASSLNFKLFIWSESADWLDAMHQARSAVHDELYARGIEIPFDQVVVHRADAAA